MKENDDEEDDDGKGEENEKIILPCRMPRVLNEMMMS